MKKVSKVFPKAVDAPARHAMARSPFARPSKRSLARDQGGAVAVMLALMLAALMGMMGLAMDLGKVWNLETQLQHAADAGALVGVTQLDGTDGARVRAIRAVVSELANNTQIFAQDNVDADGLGGPDGLDIEFDTTEAIVGGIATNRDIKFYTTIDPDTEATSDADARFIEVNVWPRTTPFSFAAVVGAVSSASPGASALAGWESLYCDSPVLMMCNPAELDEDAADPPEFNLYSSCPDDELGPFGLGSSCVGRGITMKARAGAPEPGDFGYLALSVVAPDGTVETIDGAAQLKDALANIINNAVCTGNKVTTEPGNIASLDKYINLRFDLYPTLDDSMNPNRQPSPNVGRGLVRDDPLEDLALGNCQFNPASAGPGGSDWVHPNKGKNPEDREYYVGPGKHMVTTDGGEPLWYPSTSNRPPGIVERADPAIPDVYIRAMAYPKDTCNYTLSDTDDTVFKAANNGKSIRHGPGKCLYKVPPGDPTPQGRQMGTGQWDIQIYLDVYHPGMIEDDFLDPCDPDLCADLPDSSDPPHDTPNGIISRWELYNWEKKEASPPTEPVTYPNMAFEEEPICYKGGKEFTVQYNLPELPATPAIADRRIMIMAVVNCDAMGGGKRTTPRTEPHGNVAVFLTEPMGYTVADTLFGEIVDPTGLGVGSIDQAPELTADRIVLIR